VRHDGPYRIRFQSIARKDVHRIYVYYSRVSRELADDFEARFARACASILDAPRRWAVYAADVRRFGLTRFPVNVFYRILDAEVHILRALDQRRHPDTWRCPP
jgi:plasmid stabilization system protein ParE